MSTNTRKGEVKRLVVVVIAIVLLLAVIGGTYSKYTSGATGSGTVSIAKWQVKVNGDNDISTASADFNLTFTYNNADTVANKIAPGGTATAYVDVDLTGTEVSVEFAVDTNTTALTNALSATFGTNYAEMVTVTTGTPILLDSPTPSSMTLDETNDVVTVGSTAMTGVVRVPVILTWNGVTTYNEADTTTGATKTNFTLPVTLTVSQKI